MPSQMQANENHKKKTCDSASASKNNTSSANRSGTSPTTQFDVSAVNIQGEAPATESVATANTYMDSQDSGQQNAVTAAEQKEKRVTRQLAIWSLAVAALSAVFAGMSYHESKEARLDVLRSQIRSEALQEISNGRMTFAVFNCYAAIRGVNNLTGKEALQNLMDKTEPKIRESLNALPGWDESALLVFQQSLNETAGSRPEHLGKRS